MMQYFLFYIYPPTRLTLAIAIFLMHYPNELLNVVNILCVIHILRLRTSTECNASKLFFNESKVSSLLLVRLWLKRHKNVYKNCDTLLKEIFIALKCSKISFFNDRHHLTAEHLLRIFIHVYSLQIYYYHLNGKYKD
jgi:hypothetical protein